MKTYPDPNRDFNLAEACQQVFSPTRPPEQHSPLPWQSIVHDHYGLIIRKIQRDGSNAGIIARLNGQEGKPAELSDEAKANAAYIVKAANEYPKLKSDYDKLYNHVKRKTKMKTYSDTFEPIPNPTRPNTDIQSETDLRDYLESAFTVEDLRHALYNEREKTSQAIRKLVAQRDELLAALKETTDALYNETAGKEDSPWIASVKVRAVNAYADCKAIAKREAKP